MPGMFTEQTVPPPQLPGQPTLRNSRLVNLRRQQLHDYAKAYGIEVKADGTAQEILPVLLEAELAGVFEQEPKRPEYKVKAGRCADEPTVDWEAHRPPGMDLSNIKTLRSICKEHNETAPEGEKINSFHMTAETLRAELEKVGAV